MPEEETEILVGKVKEKKMGELFANMDKMDIQAERRKTAEAEKRAEEAEKKAEEVQKRAEQKIDETYNIGIQKLVQSFRDTGEDKAFVVGIVQKAYGLGIKEAQGKVDIYWEK